MCNIESVTLDEWVRKEGRGELSRLARVAGLHYTTVFYARHRTRRLKYATAKRISEATGGKVSIDELCDAEPSTGTEG